MTKISCAIRIFSIYRFTVITLLFLHHGFCCLFSYLVLQGRKGERHVCFLTWNTVKQIFLTVLLLEPFQILSASTTIAGKSYNFKFSPTCPHSRFHSATVHVWLVCFVILAQNVSTYCCLFSSAVHFTFFSYLLKLLPASISLKPSRMCFQQVSNHDYVQSSFYFSKDSCLDQWENPLLFWIWLT